MEVAVMFLMMPYHSGSHQDTLAQLLLTFESRLTYTDVGCQAPCNSVPTPPNFSAPYSGSSEAGIAQWYSAGLRNGWLGVRVPARAGNFSFHHRVQNGSGAHPSSYAMGTRGLFKRPGREADHLPPSSSEIRNVWSYTSISPIRLHGVV
jgi:hypothetical protein